MVAAAVVLILSVLLLMSPQVPQHIGAYKHVTLKPSGPKTVDIAHTIIVDANAILEITPGITMKFAPGTGIDCHGTLLAKGTQDKPITFTASDSDLGWSNVCIDSTKGDPSSFSYCTFLNARGKFFFPTLNPNQPKDLREVCAIRGGALTVFDSSSLVMEDCTFKNCQACAGGAVYLGLAANFTIVNCFFIDCIAQRQQGEGLGGGGSLFIHDSYGHISHTVFCNNEAQGFYASGGACFLYNRATCSFQNCLFRSNHASYSGGAIYLINGSSSTSTGTFYSEKVKPSTFDFCDFVANSAGSYGGAILADPGSNCDLGNNAKFFSNQVGPTEITPFKSDLLQCVGPAIAMYKPAADKSERVTGYKSSLFRFNCVFTTDNKLTTEDKNKQIRAVDDGSAEASFFILDFPVKNDSYKVTPARDVDRIGLASLGKSSTPDADSLPPVDIGRAQTGQLDGSQLAADTTAALQLAWYPCVDVLQKFGASVHYLIARDGLIIRLVRDNNIVYSAHDTNGTPNTLFAPTAQSTIEVGLELDQAGGNVNTGYSEKQNKALQMLIELIYWKHYNPCKTQVWSIVEVSEVEHQPGILGTIKQPLHPKFEWRRFRDDSGRILGPQIWNERLNNRELLSRACF